MKKLIASFLTLSFLTFGGISHANDVVATIKPLHSLVQAVMGDTGHPKLLVEGYHSPHGFEMKPSHIMTLKNADIIFYIDKDFEVFLNKPLLNLPKNIKLISIAQKADLNILKNRKKGAWETSHKETHHDHHHGTEDFHIWLNPDNARKIVNLIADELSLLYPKNQAIYQKNAQKMREKIRQTDTKIAKELASVQHKNFIVFHDAYQYFEKYYGLTSVGSLTIEPHEALSIKQLQDIKKTIVRKQAVCIFKEPQFSDRKINTVIEGTNTKIGTLDPLGSGLTDGEDLYINLLKNLADDFKKCLGA